jgi:hypothetical protein
VTSGPAAGTLSGAVARQGRVRGVRLEAAKLDRGQRWILGADPGEHLDQRQADRGREHRFVQGDELALAAEIEQGRTDEHVAVEAQLRALGPTAGLVGGGIVVITVGDGERRDPRRSGEQDVDGLIGVGRARRGLGPPSGRRIAIDQPIG